MYAALNRVSIASGNGLLSVLRQTIAWTSAGLLSNGPLGTNFSQIQIKLVIHENALFENAVCEMVAACVCVCVCGVGVGVGVGVWMRLHVFLLADNEWI